VTTPLPPLDRVPALLAAPGVAHGFTSRLGGVSSGVFRSLNLAPREGEAPGAVARNWDLVARALDPRLDASRVALLHQVHGADVARVGAPGGPEAVVATADASFTTEPDVILAVRVADCVPVLFAGPGVVGVAHAGWRGAASRVCDAVLDAMIAATGAPADAFVAAIGPCISAAAFEVGPEVVEGLVAGGVPEATVVSHGGPRGRPHVDLPAVVAWQLARRGVRAGVVARCTVADPELYSHRRDGPVTGRSAGVVVRCS
jgi:YfiH family protein